MRGLAVAIAIAVLTGLTAPAFADEPAPGEIVIVTCRENTEQRYACYLPGKYDAEQSWPILYCFSPAANGEGFVRRYKEVCEKRGWIVVGSMNSRNGPWAPIQAAIDAMWKDTGERLSLSDTMRYASGFSGGSRVSFAVARMHAPKIAGVIGVGAGLSDGKLPRPELAVYLMCGETDPNKRELDPLHEKLEKAGNPVRYENFAGGHVMPANGLLTKAVEWMDDIAEERRVERFAAALVRARELSESEPLEAFLTLDDALATYPGVKRGRSDAQKLHKKLARNPAVKPEISARKAFDAAAAWLAKNRERVEKYPAVRAQAAKRFETVVAKFPDTPTAERARVKIEELQSTDE